MILSDYHIGRLVEKYGMIDPYFPISYKGPGACSYGQSSAGYDLTLGTEFTVYTVPLWRRLLGLIIPSVNPPLDPEKPIAKWRVKTIVAKEFIIPAGGFVLAHTNEVVTFPRDVTGELKDKSTLARYGLSIQNTTGEPGWSGQYVVEIHNSAPHAFVLRAGQGIGQLVFKSMSGPCEVSYADRKGKYQDQRGVTLPRSGE